MKFKVQNLGLASLIPLLSFVLLTCTPAPSPTPEATEQFVLDGSWVGGVEECMEVQKALMAMKGVKEVRFPSGKKDVIVICAKGVITKKTLREMVEELKSKIIGYFPLRVGDKRVYQMDNRKEYIEEIVEETTVRVIKYAVMMRYIDGRGWGSYHYTLTSRGVELDEHVNQHLELVLKYPLQKGDAWEYSIHNWTYTCKNEGEEQVTVPAGTFKCYKVSYVLTTPRRSTLGNRWYAAGVGLIKEVEEEYENGPLYVLELREFIRGK